MNMISPVHSVSSVLATRAMIVSLNISQWEGRRIDRKVTNEVNQQHNAAADAGRYNKLLLPKEALATIQSIVSATRTEFHERTLPWMDKGGRIMASDGYLAHISWIRAQTSKFERAVDEFIVSYPDYVNDAQQRLGSLFKQDDYPSADELRAKFRVDCRVFPVPTATDFRVDMSDAQAELIRQDIERNVADATTSAVQDVYKRVADVTGRMVERLNAYKPAVHKGEKSEGVFRDSLVENIRDLITVLPALNITGDPELTAMADKLKPLAEHNASTLRDNPTIRRDVADEAAKIFLSVSEYFA